VVGGNRGIFVNWWNQQLKANPSFTDYSNCVDPSSAAAGMYLALDIANGKTVPQNIIYPNVEITDSTLKTYVAMGMADNDLAMNTPTLDWVRSTLETQKSATLPLS
jgi:ribose transport system substrate-binding protein